MSKKTELVEAILKIRKKENDLAESKHLYTLTNQQLEKIYNSESKRTEQEVLKDFEELGYSIIKNEWFLELINTNSGITIDIDLKDKEYWKENSYRFTMRFTMQEHKLLTELFTIWG